jgi:high-affinity iron transporter
MLKLFVVLFRETLEISIILSIIIAATQNIKNRNIHIYIGIIIGILGAALLAFSTNYISYIFEGYGQEIINAVTLLVAASLIIWTIIWIKVHTKKIVVKIKNKSEQITAGESSLISLSIIVAAIIFREGAEIALFSYGILITTLSNEMFNTILGGIFGFILATLIGFALYKGIITVSGKKLLKVSTLLLSLVAASMASQASTLLVASEVITIFTTPLWNTSQFISQGSVLGILLNNLVGYVEQPTGIEIIFYFGTLITIIALSNLANKAHVAKSKR